MELDSEPLRASESEQAEVTLPSVSEAEPLEEGGPSARQGFAHQDEIGVSFLIEMLERSDLLRVQCETQDDLVLVWENDDGSQVAEFVQVKAVNLEQLWSVAALCQASEAGMSLFEKSLSCDRCEEQSRFRIVTSRPVARALKPLTYPLEAPGRDPETEFFRGLVAELERRCPDARSAKDNGASFWAENCLWQECHSLGSVQNDNFRRLISLSSREGQVLLPQFVRTILEELRGIVRKASELKWGPHRDEKIITRGALRGWWERRKRELIEQSPVGKRLRRKMLEACMPQATIELAQSLRRSYIQERYTPRYMQQEEAAQTSLRVRSEIATLQSLRAAGQIRLSGAEFHHRCFEVLDSVNRDLVSRGAEDRAAFLRGCMYDMADRCQLRFLEPSQ
jgi:hypothetical protein